MKPPHNDPERAWKIAQLAAVLASKPPPELANSKDLLASNNRLVELGWAVRDAERILAASEDATSRVYAYQLFEGGWYSIDKARAVFKRNGWRRLTSWHSVDNLFAEILRALKQMTAPPSADSAAVQMDLDLPSSIPPENALFWRDPDTLVSGKGAKREYLARPLLLAAHAYLGERFANRLVRDFH